MYKKSWILIALLGLCTILAGCGTTTVSEDHTFLDGAVQTHFFHTTASHNSDYISFTFSRAGDYQISFSIPSGGDDFDVDELPSDFTLTVSQVPTTKVVEKW